jgi:hypothetical protein
MTISPGLHTVEDVGDDLWQYQMEKEPELHDFRRAQSSSVVRAEELVISGQRTATGEFRLAGRVESRVLRQEPGGSSTTASTTSS